MLENIKKMKNKIGNFIDFDNSPSKNSLTLSCSTSINEEMKLQSNANNYININDHHQPKKTTKEVIRKKNLVFIQKKRKNEKKEKYKNDIDKININNDLFVNYNCFEDNNFKDWPNNLFEIMPKNLGLSLKQEINNDENQIINFENQKFILERKPDLTEKDFDFSLKNENNFLLCYNNANEKNNDIDDDCSSRITNLYLQEYKYKNY